MSAADTRPALTEEELLALRLLIELGFAEARAELRKDGRNLDKVLAEVDGKLKAALEAWVEPNEEDDG